MADALRTYDARDRTDAIRESNRCWPVPQSPFDCSDTNSHLSGLVEAITIDPTLEAPYVQMMDAQLGLGQA